MRSTDDVDHDGLRLSDLIEKTSNEEFKAALLLLSRANARWETVAERIADRLDGMSDHHEQLVKQHTDFHAAFVAHDKREMELLASIRGARWASAALSGVVSMFAGMTLALLIWGGNIYREKIADLEQSRARLEVRVLVLEEQRKNGANGVK
jgi:hypothetical protein